MNNISVNFCYLPYNLDNLGTFLKSIKASCSTMIFTTKDCYEYIKNNFAFMPDKNKNSHLKTFMYNGSNKDRVYLSLMPIYSGDFFYLETIFSKSVKHQYADALPNNIVIIALQGEKIYTKPSVVALTPWPDDCPVNCIMEHYPEFQNAIFILTNCAYQRLIPQATLMSNYENSYRLTWHSDEVYMGGSICLKKFDNDCNYLIENMNFPFFQKNYSISGLPSVIYFIV